MRGDVVRRDLERLSAVEEHWILAAFVAVVSAAAVYWYMRSRMR